MNARPLHVMLIAAAVVLPAITARPTFAETEKTLWNVHELYKQCQYKGSLERIFCLEFVSNTGRQVITNGLALKDLNTPLIWRRSQSHLHVQNHLCQMMRWLRPSASGQTNILKNGVQARTQE